MPKEAIMNKVSVFGLKGAALDWAVAAAQNEQYKEDRLVKWSREEPTLPAKIEREKSLGSYTYHLYSPSTDWNCGGEIIVENGVSVSHRDNSPSIWDAIIKPDFYSSGIPNSGVKKEVIASGPTPLIAAMRCYVISVLSDEIVIPDDL